MGIPLMGSIPGLINENTPLWDWKGQLWLSMDPSLIRFVDVTGTGGNFFDATLDRRTGMVAITPMAMADYEWFSANHQSPTLSLNLRFFMTDGTVQTGSGSYSVTVLDVDDTPPQALRFATGGSVKGGAAGAVIGTLAVTDPDTPDGFIFTLREDDEWMFEIANGVLKLRAGVSLAMGDGPTRPVVIDVWDGQRSAAFTLDISITLPGSSGGPGVDTLEQGERIDGFHWADAGTVRGEHMLYEIASLRQLGDYRVITMRDGDTVTFRDSEKIDLLDGTVYFRADTQAGWTWNVYDTILDREARNYEMWSVDFYLDKGWVSPDQLIVNLLNSAEFSQKFGALSNAGFVEHLYRNTSGWVDAGGAAYHTQRLDHGVSRLTLVKDFMNWRDTALGQVQDRADDGIFVLRVYTQQVDILYRVGAGFTANSDYRDWSSAIAEGRTTLGDLTAAIASTAGYASHMGALPTRSFVEQFFSQAVGFAPDVATVDHFTQAIDSGSYSRVQYMELVAWTISVPSSYVYQAPLGEPFGNPW